MIFGYARVSTSDQSLNLQIDALLQEGIERKNIYTDKVSSTSAIKQKNGPKKIYQDDRPWGIRAGPFDFDVSVQHAW